MQNKVVGKRKYVICLVAILAYLLIIFGLAAVDKSFSLSASHIAAIGGGVIGIVGVTIYGYTKEYMYEKE